MTVRSRIPQLFPCHPWILRRNRCQLFSGWGVRQYRQSSSTASYSTRVLMLWHERRRFVDPSTWINDRHCFELLVERTLFDRYDPIEPVGDFVAPLAYLDWYLYVGKGACSRDFQLARRSVDQHLTILTLTGRITVESLLSTEIVSHMILEIVPTLWCQRRVKCIWQRCSVTHEGNSVVVSCLSRRVGSCSIENLLVVC